MKSLLIGLVSLSAFLACSRPADEDKSLLLEGSWKMVSVHDLASGEVFNNNDPGEVRMQIAPENGSTALLSGNTPVNEFYSDLIITQDSGFSVPALNHTKVNERPWGRLFLDNMPHALKYSLGNSMLMVKTTNQKLLTFVKE